MGDYIGDFSPSKKIGAHLKRFVKTIILIPAYPLIWLALYADIFDCEACWDNKCAMRAEAMLAWRSR